MEIARFRVGRRVRIVPRANSRPSVAGHPMEEEYCAVPWQYLKFRCSDCFAKSREMWPPVSLNGEISRPTPDVPRFSTQLRHRPSRAECHVCLRLNHFRPSFPDTFHIFPPSSSPVSSNDAIHSPMKYREEENFRLEWNVPDRFADTFVLAPRV